MTSTPPSAATIGDAELEQKEATSSTTQKNQSNAERIPQILNLLTSKNESKLIAENLKILRDLLSSNTQHASDEVFAHGGVERLLDVLSVDDEEIQVDALICFVRSPGRHAEQALALGLLSRLVELLASSSEKVRSETYLLLGETAGISTIRRDLTLSSGIVPQLLESGRVFDSAIFAETVQRCTYLLAQLCRHKPSPPLEIVGPLIPTIKGFLRHPIPQVRANACWAVSYLTDGPPARILAVQEYDVLNDVLALLRSENPLVALPALRTFGNFCATNPEMTQIIIDQGIPQLLPPFLNLSVAADIRKEVCWIISNTCAGYDTQVQAVQDAGLFPLAVANIVAPEFQVRREAILAIANAAATATIERLRYLAETCDVLPNLCHVLASKDSRICAISLEAIEAILNAGDNLRENINGTNPYVIRIEQVKGTRSIFDLLDHEDHSTRTRAQKVMDTYFPDFDEEEEEEKVEGEGYDEGKHEFKDDEDMNFNI